ncbi:hypothetical protein JYG23_07620 [Sedimentibacter sp. zth1]|uniref:flagellar M-ring protein FliF C-terminal domain-containing protein n=1 Tax=Sedimentibacter sp. zth1 TaxID=2816908 RepID=UPI001A917A61|nr:hypothetical protein JYG23_07620 [Sedimentibacter sp. zth1]
MVGEGEAKGGVVGTENNSEVPVYPEVTINGDDIYYKDKSTIDYLVSQIKEQVQHEPGSIEKMTVAVIVNKEKMTDDEKSNMKELIAYAAGIDIKDVALHNIKFNEPIVEVFDDKGNVKALTDKEKMIIAVGIVALILILFIIILISKKIKKAKLKKLEKEMIENPNQDTSEDSWDSIKDDIEVKETKEVALKKQISEFSSTNPEITAQLIRTWLKGEDN